MHFSKRLLTWLILLFWSSILSGQSKDKDRNSQSRFTHEFYSNIYIREGSGQLTSDSNKKSLKESQAQGTLGYGYFLTPILEPIVEAQFYTNLNKIGKFNLSSTDSVFGLGLLFNLLPEQPTGKSKNYKNSIAYNLIPYGGFIIGSRMSSNNLKDENSKTTSSNTTISTKLTFGIRYLLFNEVAINSWVRASYENANQTSSANAEEKGLVSKIVIELKLLSLSVII